MKDRRISFNNADSFSCHDQGELMSPVSLSCYRNDEGEDTKLYQITLTFNCCATHNHNITVMTDGSPKVEEEGSEKYLEPDLLQTSKHPTVNSSIKNLVAASNLSPAEGNNSCAHGRCTLHKPKRHCFRVTRFYVKKPNLQF